MKRKLTLLLLALFLLTFPSAGETRNYADTISFINDLDSNFKVKKLETINYGNESFPVYKISYNPQKGKKGKKYLVISGVHGNEPAPVYAVRDFIISLNGKKVQRSELQIDFLFIVNPYGFKYNQRYNKDNADINRDMKLFKTQEARIIKNNFKAKDYSKVFDLHEANCTGFFLYCYGMKNMPLAEKIHKHLEVNNVVFENKYKDKILQVENGRLFVPFYASTYMKMNNTVTNGIYFLKCSNSFTFETSKNIKFEERKRIYSLILNYIIEKV